MARAGEHIAGELDLVRSILQTKTRIIGTEHLQINHEIRHFLFSSIVVSKNRTTFLT